MSQFIDDAGLWVPTWGKSFLFWLAAATAVISVAMYAWEKGWLSRRGKLRLTYRPELPFIVETPANIVVNGAVARFPSRWFRVEVAGECPSARVFLAKVERQVDGRFVDQHLAPPQQLGWANEVREKFQPRALGPDQSLWVDVLWVDQYRNRIVVAWETDWGQFANLFVAPGVYRLTLRAVGDGRKSTELALRLIWDGIWNTTQLIADGG